MHIHRHSKQFWCSGKAIISAELLNAIWARYNSNIYCKRRVVMNTLKMARNTLFKTCRRGQDIAIEERGWTQQKSQKTAERALNAPVS